MWRDEGRIFDDNNNEAKEKEEECARSAIGKNNPCSLAKNVLTNFFAATPFKRKESRPLLNVSHRRPRPRCRLPQRQTANSTKKERTKEIFEYGEGAEHLLNEGAGEDDQGRAATWSWGENGRERNGIRGGFAKAKNNRLGFAWGWQ